MAIDRMSNVLDSISEGGKEPVCVSPASSNGDSDGSDIDAFIREIENLKSQVELLEVKNASLSEKIRDLEVKIKRNEEKFNSDAKKKEELIMSLQQQIHSLKQELEECRRGEDILYICQVAFLFEQAICSYVMPAVFLNDKHAPIKQLLNYLNGGIELPVEQGESNEREVLSAARKRWDEVCELLQLPGEWKKKAGDWRMTDRTLPGVIKAIALLKRKRIAVAHPECISLQVAEVKIESDSTKNSFPIWQIKVVKDLIGFLQSPVLQANIMDTELHQIFEKLKLKLN